MLLGTVGYRLAAATRRWTSPAWLPLTALVLGGACVGAMPAIGASRPPIRVTLDAREAPRRILHTHLVFPVSPGVVPLTYPKWLPGHHTPSGPVRDVTGLVITAAGKPIPWRRDPVDFYTIRFDAPQGVREVEVRFDFVFPEDAGEGAEEPSLTERLAMLNWHTVVMFPTGAASDSLIYEARLRLPPGYRHATALRGRVTGEEIRFDPVTLTELIDSPVLAGRYLRSVALSRDDRPVSLELACDSEAGLAMPDDEVARYRRLVEETDALFGARHFRSYRFLVALSDLFEGDATEHHESSENRFQERTWLESTLRLMNTAVLPHEYVHSWCGKYRRPIGLATPDYSEPMRDELLWVYEGLTEYLGIVLTARSGLYTPEQCRGDLASSSAYLDRATGHTWRPLVDTAVEAPLLYAAPRAWRSWRRGADYYSESVLIWLEADVTIRRLSNNTRSLDDFCRAFFGGTSGPPRVVPYTLDDVVNGLERVAHHDWGSFFEQRLERVTSGAPLGGIEGAGWRIAYTDTATEYISAAESAYDYANLFYSLGLRLGTPSGLVADVIMGAPAERAGVAPGMTLVAVNGRKWSSDVLNDALVAARKSKQPIELLFSNGDFFRTFRVDYDGGPRYPRLERVPGKPDVLSRILAPRRPRAGQRR